MAYNQRSNTLQDFKRLVESLGRNTAHILYPNDFEAYTIALELVDSDGRVVDFFVFPIMPDSISEDYSKISNTRKTAGGITALTTPNFTSRTITIEGNFGRNFKFVMGNNTVVDASAIQFSVRSGNYVGGNTGSFAVENKTNIFSNQIKTGYGCFKILYGIHEKSTTLDHRNQPFKLYFYNLAQGEHYLVKSLSLRSSQTLDENMLWNYEYQMEAIAPINTSKKERRQTNFDVTKASALNEGADIVLAIAKNLLSTDIT